MSLGVFELRNYVMQPTLRDHFIDYFEAHFIFSQQAVEMHVLGQFRVIGQPDRFVWIRGFTDMTARLSGLNGFYYGAVWEKYRETANAMILDSDHVHLLRPVGIWADLADGHTPQTVAEAFAAGTISIKTGIFAIDFYQTASAMSDTVAGDVAQAYAQAGIRVRGVLATEMSENDFPRLPVIQNAGEVVIISAYESEAHYDQQQALLGAVSVSKRGESLLLAPTLRSPMRW